MRLNPRCSQLTGTEVFFKEDLRQLTGSFKVG
jgi:threonine dehydratase